MNKRGHKGHFFHGHDDGELCQYCGIPLFAGDSVISYKNRVFCSLNCLGFHVGASQIILESQKHTPRIYSKM